MSKQHQTEKEILELVDEVVEFNGKFYDFPSESDEDLMDDSTFRSLNEDRLCG